MITREDIRELAKFQCEKRQECALSFYFQPHTPQDKSHREEGILAKDLVRKAISQLEHHGKGTHTRADLEKILEIAGRLHGNQARAKAIFACSARNIWREFDLPPRLARTELYVNRVFHLQPLAHLLGAESKLWVVLLDRRTARFFDLRLEDLKERQHISRDKIHRGRGDGYAGYEGGRAQRRVEEDALHHYKDVAAQLKHAQEHGQFESLIVGCQDINWPDFEPQLHPYVRKAILGRFAGELAKLSLEQIRDQAARIRMEWLERRRTELVREAIGQAKSGARGVTGLRRVLRSLELGEVQTLILGEHYSARAVECTGCGHIDSHIVRYCPACGRATRELENVCDSIVPVAIRRDIELLYVNDEELDQVGNIAARLRFRADHSTAGLAVA